MRKEGVTVGDVVMRRVMVMVGEGGGEGSCVGGEGVRGCM